MSEEVNVVEAIESVFRQVVRGMQALEYGELDDEAGFLDAASVGCHAVGALFDAVRGVGDGSPAEIAAAAEALTAIVGEEPEPDFGEFSSDDDDDAAAPAVSAASAESTPTAPPVEEIRIEVTPEILADFVAESREQLERIETEIVELEANPTEGWILNSVFRGLHTIKGSSGFLGLNRLGTLAHAAEDVLNAARDGVIVLADDAITVVLAAIDQITKIIDILDDGRPEPDGDDAALIEQLHELAAGKLPGARAADAVSADADAADVTSGAEAGAAVSSAAAGDGADAHAPKAETTLRVGIDVLDRLMNMVGEMVLTRNQILQSDFARSGQQRPASILQLDRVTTELQEAVMLTRMQPIGNAWTKLPRVVRDVARANGKQIELVKVGAETELDRQILQSIGDPLTHMVRNSSDHGIETPAARRDAGKDPTGTITLEAFHEGGHVVIRIADDGAGIPVDAVRSKAVERGLIDAATAQAMPDQAVLQYIFEPGFSTAKAVTSVSGRGVGMDVVRTNIEAIGGSVEVASKRGEGTTFTVRIPLTLAIFSALVVGSGGEAFAIPQVGVDELVAVGGSSAHRIEFLHDVALLRLRDEMLPLVFLDEVLGMGTASRSHADEGIVLIVEVASSRYGLVVDDVHDLQEIVVKPIGRMLSSIPAYAGTTILGDGRVILILDVAGVAGMTGVLSQKHAQAAATQRPAVIGENSVDWLVFADAPGGRCAVPIGLVSRLEEVPVDAIEDIDGELTLQYRGGLIPLVPVRPDFVRATSGVQPMIVLGNGERVMGVLVAEIVDLVAARAELQSDVEARWLLGSTVIEGRATGVLDVGHLWDAAFGHAGSRTRVLLVDDDRFFQTIMSPLLHAMGYDVVTASGTDEALRELAKGDPFDAVISDLTMPDVDGYGLARRIRNDLRFARLPLLAVTGRIDRTVEAQARAAGFDACVGKLEREKLVAALSALADRPELVSAGD